MGTAFFAVLFWISLTLRQELAKSRDEVSAYIPGWTAFVGVVIYGQILLGGLVASNYAALACTDFPTCQGQWIPTLEGPVGLHVIHRLGAYTVVLVILANFLVMRNQPDLLRKNSKIMGMAVLLQIGLGISNVLFYTPPLIAVLHLAVAIKLFFLAIKQTHFAKCANGLNFRSPVVIRDALS